MVVGETDWLRQNICPRLTRVYIIVNAITAIILLNIYQIKVCSVQPPGRRGDRPMVLLAK